MKRILFVAYHFPPQGGAGVQRSLKFVKYLPSFGIVPIVFTASRPTDSKWTPPDESLENDVPPEVKIVRTPWPSGPRAERQAAETLRLELAARLVHENDVGAIFVSMSPFADAGFAARLGERCGIPWIADLRDPWALDEFQIYRTRWHRERSYRVMRRALESAALIVMNTPEAAVTLQRAFPELGPRTVSITNGFDAEDLTPASDQPRNEFYTIVHAGFLHAAAGLRQRRQPWQYRLLGRIEAGVEILPRSHYYLLRALAQWLEQEPEIASKVRFHLVGEPRSIDRELAARSPVAALTRFTGYLAHAESIRAVRQADLLFLPMHKLPPGRRASIVPGKTYEYLASGRPILAPVPQGDARDFLTQARTGLVCEPDDVDQMVVHLRSQFRAWASGAPPLQVDLDYINRFERRELTRQLALRLDLLTRTNRIAPADTPAAADNSTV